MRRIFVGIPISEEVKREILNWEQNFKFQITNFKSDLENSIRWVAPKNLHVTLVPPWRAKELKVESEKLKEIKFQPFEIKFDNISFGPNIREPRMIWATGQAGEEIKKLKKLIEIALIENVDYTRGRAYNQHVTLARVKELPPALSLAKRGELAVVDWRQTVKSFVLYESHLSPQGADYEVLERLEFKQTD